MKRSTMTPRAEYPRPHFDRSHSWSSLNGEWDFRADTEQGWNRTITVPFAWETPASGVEAHWLPVAWYRRRVTVPVAWAGQRVVLHFGAVHHEATVWVNGVEVAAHRGGYTPFEADVTEALREGEQEIVVRVAAPLDKRDIAHGKQRSVPRDDFDGVCFTPSSGIWQSVWMEARPVTHLAALKLRPAEGLTGIVAEARVESPVAETRLRLSVRGCDTSIEVPVGHGPVRVELPIEEPRLWSPDDPHLYHVDAELVSPGGTDRVAGYTGLRTIEVVGEDLYLNGRRLFVRGVLDQGYWPRTGITAPDDAALRRDIELAAAAGYNLVRKHLKLEDPRFVYHADTLGMLVWAEPAATGRFSPESVAAFEEQIAPMVERDGNSPAIVIWGLYNEEWGLDWDIPGDPAKQQAAARAYDLLKSLDATRPAVDNSGWTHVRTDLLDWHYYDESAASWGRTVAALLDGEQDDFPVRLGPDFVVRKKLAGTPSQPLRGLPNLNSEYGGGFTSVERAWHLRWQTQELRRHDRLAACLERDRAEGKRIVFTNGCFDVLHRGHVACLEEAARLGDVLVVAVNSDDGVARLKGPQRPINRCEDRVAVLAALGCVDYITVFDEDSPTELLRLVRPEVYVKGGDYHPDLLPEADLVRELGGEVRVLGYVPDRSTTAIVNRIRG